MLVADVFSRLPLTGEFINYVGGEAQIETLRVSGNSRPNAVAGAIAALIRSQRQVEVQAIGPAAVNQAVKAVAIARGYLSADQMDLTLQPSFVKLDVAAEERTAMKFMIFGYTTQPPL